MKKLTAQDIGFFGKPIDTLSKKELIEALEMVANQLKDSATKINGQQAGSDPDKATS